MSFKVIDESGVIVDEIKPGDRLVRGASVESLKQFEVIPENETFTKIYHRILPILAECDLTASSFAVFIHLSCNLRYMSNVSKYSNGKLITRDSLQQDLNLCDKSIKRSIQALIREGLIVEARTIEGKVFIVNPYVMMIGDKVNRTVFDLFRKSKWARW